MNKDNIIDNIPHKYEWFYNNKLLLWIERNRYITALKQGLMLCIPILIIGALCTLLTSFPIPAYQEWLAQALGGWLHEVIMWIYNATSSLITLYVIIAVSYSYGDQYSLDEKAFYILTSIIGFVIFAIEDIQTTTLSIFNTTWLIVGIVITLLCCFILDKLLALFKKNIYSRMLTGLEMGFRKALLVIIPSFAVFIVCALLKVLLALIPGLSTSNISSIFTLKLFDIIGTNLLGSLVLIFLLHFLWFFGIHGSNMLIIPYYVLFQAGMPENIAAIANGEVPQHIFTRTFFDSFVMLGGCGATLCLLIAIMFSKRKMFKTMFKISIIPAIFNINEIVLFGFPIIFNPIMLISFILVPLILMCVAALSMYLGLVPIPFREILWTTPVIFSGYITTGSIAGSILQIVLLAIGTVTYLPFIKASENYYSLMLQQNVNDLIKEMESFEHNGDIIDFQNTSKEKRDAARMLTHDLQYAMDNNQIMLYYQPQINRDGTIYGIEALLRWNHPVVGFIYPPLVIELARQAGLLDELGIQLIAKAANDLDYFSNKITHSIHMAVNISPAQFANKNFCSRVVAILDKHDFKNCTMCFEVTEQLAMVLTDEIHASIETLRSHGINFHMDDFGMGHSSMRYLQNNKFEVVKLDGSLVKEIVKNSRSQDIINGIGKMAHSLNYELIAEYVETKEQRDLLEGLGCTIYQGALYSLAIPKENLEEFLEAHNRNSTI